MKILFLVHRYPHPPNRGDRIRSFHFLEYLSRLGEVTLGTLYEEPPSEESRAVTASLCREVIACPWRKYRKWRRAGMSLLCGKTMTEGLFYDRELRNRLKRLAKERHFDVIIVFCSSMFQYVDIFTKNQRKSGENVPAAPRVIVDLVDVDSQKWFDYAKVARIPARWLFLTEGKRLRRLETKIDASAERLLVVTPEEAEVYRGFHPAGKITAVRNGVDTKFFDPDLPELSAVPEIPYRCVFVGALDYRANVDGVLWFLKEVWPAVREQFPEAEFDIVGSNPVSALRRAAETVPGANLVGGVPDVRPYLKRAAVVVIALRIARGIQNKVLEGLAMRRPVVASRQSAEGIEAASGKELMVCDLPGEWINTISSLFKNEILRYKTGYLGREFVENHYAWEACLAPLENLLIKKEKEEP